MRSVWSWTGLPADPSFAEASEDDWDAEMTLCRLSRFTFSRDGRKKGRKWCGVLLGGFYNGMCANGRFWFWQRNGLAEEWPEFRRWGGGDGDKCLQPAPISLREGWASA